MVKATCVAHLRGLHGHSSVGRAELLLCSMEPILEQSVEGTVPSPLSLDAWHAGGSEELLCVQE